MMYTVLMYILIFRILFQVQFVTKLCFPLLLICFCSLCIYILLVLSSFNVVIQESV